MKQESKKKTAIITVCGKMGDNQDGGIVLEASSSS
jgi:hypothetical protein